uniref:CCHC-type domain-containing protein n=1 Tax=Varanus komodoensis TaxID=61221 RepID=A0A8D2LG94_VARKO
MGEAENKRPRLHNPVNKSEGRGAKGEVGTESQATGSAAGEGMGVSEEGQGSEAGKTVEHHTGPCGSVSAFSERKTSSRDEESAIGRKQRRQTSLTDMDKGARPKGAQREPNRGGKEKLRTESVSTNILHGQDRDGVSNAAEREPTQTHTGTLPRPKTYASVANNQREPETGRVGGPFFGAAFEEEEDAHIAQYLEAASDTRDPRKRFVVRFRYVGTDPNRDTRTYLTKTLMREVLKIEKEQVVAVIQLPGSGETDVCLASELAYWKFWAKCKAAQRANPSLLEGFEVAPLLKDDTGILTVIFRTTTIPEEDVARWVSRYAVILNGPYKRIDEEGFWTGEYRCVVSFKNQSQDNRQGKIPKYFFLGAERGITRYSGQPSACYHCGSYEHYRRTCTTQLCSRCCGKGHSTLACQRGIRCNLCEEAGHTYYWCPQAYYNRQD